MLVAGSAFVGVGCGAGAAPRPEDTPAPIHGGAEATRPLDLCAVAMGEVAMTQSIALFPLENVTFVLTMTQPSEHDEGCSTRLFEIREGALTEVPARLQGLPSCESGAVLQNVRGRFPDAACAEVYEHLDTGTYRYEGGTWKPSPQLSDTACADSQPWLGERFIGLRWRYHPGRSVAPGEPGFELEVHPPGGPRLPALAHGRISNDEEPDRMPFAFGAGRDGTVVVGWQAATSGEGAEVLIEQWIAGETATTTVRVPGEFKPLSLSQSEVHMGSRDDIDVLAWEQLDTSPLRPVGLHYDGRSWQRLDLPRDALTSTMGRDGAMLFLGRDHLTVRERDGALARRSIRRVLVDGVEVRLELSHDHSPRIWEPQPGELWLASDIPDPKHSDRTRRALFHPCPETAPLRLPSATRGPPASPPESRKPTTTRPR